MTWVEGWTDTYADMQLKVYENTLIYSELIDFPVSPVGWAWNTVLEKMNYLIDRVWLYSLIFFVVRPAFSEFKTAM